ncbi:MAG: hypothetical protein R2883_01500 [Caldisericia bacterium]
MRPELRRDYSKLFFGFYLPYEEEYLLAYHKTGGQAPTTFLGPDCCHYEPGFSADDPFNPRKPVIYPGFGTIYPYCDVMIKSYRRCSHKTSKTIQMGKDYLMIIIGGDQCASVGCKSFREEHDTFFTFIPSVEFESDYTKTFSRFSEIYPLEFKPMLPNECWHYTNEPGSIFLFEHDWNNEIFKLSVGKTPGDFEMFFDLDLKLSEWNQWLEYVYHMKKLGR